VAGKGDQRETRKFSDELGLGNNVVYTGFIPDPFLLGLYRTCDVYVCPSRLEGFGITLLDAQLYAKRAVATKVGPIPEIASRDTLLVEPEDVEGMASAILRSLRPEGAFSSITDEEDAAFKASFSWEKAARMVIEQYGLAVKGR
jgi:glycosyltransferase involved in cell wall biosynthesis